MRSVAVDLKEERFDVAYDPDQVTPREMLAAITKLGYFPELVPSPAGERAANDAPSRVDVAALPADVQAVFQRSLVEQKPVLLRFTGPGCVTCREMDTVTYPDTGVTHELATHWLVVPIDVTTATDLAGRFGVHAIPTAVAARGDGHVVGRIEGFVPPAAFLGRAAELRAAR